MMSSKILSGQLAEALSKAERVLVHVLPPTLIPLPQRRPQLWGQEKLDRFGGLGRLISFGQPEPVPRAQ